MITAAVGIAVGAVMVYSIFYRLGEAIKEQGDRARAAVLHELDVFDNALCDTGLDDWDELDGQDCDSTALISAADWRAWASELEAPHA